jgi:hypothetical protein
LRIAQLANYTSELRTAELRDGVQAVVDAAREQFPNLTVEANSTKPRRNSFNLKLNDVTVWDGLTLGPPRALKFDILLGTRLHDEIIKVNDESE